MALLDEQSTASSWQRPQLPNVAHFDLFSGAAGDMMLAACLEAGSALNPDLPKNALLDRCVHRLKKGIPSIADEFSVTVEQVWRGTGSLAASYVNVQSIYHHHPAPVPNKQHELQAVSSHHSHGHDHGRTHHHEHHSTNSGETPGSNDDPTKTSHKSLIVTKPHEHSHSTDSTPLMKDQDNPHHTHQHHNHHHHHHHQDNHNIGPLRNFPQIRDMIDNASDQYLPPWVKTTAVAAFHALATAECHVHGASSIDQVHFHEVGAIDSIADVLLTLLALYELHCKIFTFSPMPLGYGTVQTAHGLLPVPAPATLFLMRNRPVVAGPPGWTGELVTPTAAALIHVLSSGDNNGRPPKFTLRAVGVGAGKKDFANHPNVLRLMIGEVSYT